MKQGTLILIEWSDAGTINRWEEMEDLLRELHESDAESFFTVGFLIRETSEWLSVAQTINYNGDRILERATDTMSIPKGMVKEVKVLLKEAQGEQKEKEEVS